MGPAPVCERCGLRQVRYELERRGIVVRFCDECYWGELEAPAEPGPGGAQPAEIRRPTEPPA